MAKWAEQTRYFMDVAAGRIYLIKTADADEWNTWVTTMDKPVPAFAQPVTTLNSISFTNPVVIKHEITANAHQI